MVTYISCMSLSIILPKCAKTMESKDEHCLSWCTFILYMQPYIPRQL